MALTALRNLWLSVANTPDPVLGTSGAGTVADPLAIKVTDSLGGSGCYATTTFTPAAAAYSAGDIQDTAKAITWYYANGVAVPATAIIRVTGSIFKVNLSAVPSGQTSFTMALLKAARATPLADNNAWSLPADEVDNYMDKFSLGTPAVVGSILAVRQSGLTNDYQMVASGMVAEFITDGAYTATGVVCTVKLLGVVL